MVNKEQIEKLKLIVKRNLKQKRFNHSLGVMQSAYDLAKRHASDPEKALVAGILHDITKEYSSEQHMELVAKYNVPLDDGEKNIKKLWHAITSATFAEFELGIEDREVLDAIRYHTTAKANMSTLGKIIYIADFIEPNRDYSDVDFFRKIAFEDLDRTMYLGIKWSMEEILKKESYLHVNTLNGYNYYTINYNKI